MIFLKFKLKRFLSNSSIINKKSVLICKKIKQGWTNNSYNITLKNKKQFYVRLTKTNDIVDRKNELEVFKLLSISYIYYEESSGNLIKDWILAKEISYWSDETLVKFAQKLYLFHKHTVNKNINSFNHFQFFNKAKKNGQLEIIYQKIYEKHQNDSTALCHNDLHKWNILQDAKEELIFIDYEWTQINYPLWDLANFVREENLNAYQIGLLIASYDKKIKMQDFYDFLFMTAFFGWQWTFSLTPTIKVLKRRKQMFKYTNWVLKNFINQNQII